MANYLFAMSSNATKEYMTDILEVLSSPKGWVHHYRYQLKYIDEELKKNLGYKGESVKESIKNIRTVICFLYQVDKGTEGMEWNSVYPVRIGKLVDAYKTGDSDRDIAHIFFKVDDYFVYDGNDFTDITKDALGDKYNKYYAVLGNSISDGYIASIAESKQALHKTVESLEIEHFQLPSGDKYFPIYTNIEGLSIGNKIINPSYDKNTRSSYYKIDEGSRYIFSFSTYFKEQPPEFSLEIISNKDVFATPDRYVLNVASRYDEESWSLASRILNQDTWSNIIFQSNSESVDGKRPLNINLMMPIHILRKMHYRVTEIIADISYASAIIVVAASRILTDWEEWYIPLIILFSLWAITKGVSRWWRG